MAEFIIANMAPLMFGALVVFLLFGYPVAFALAANGIVFGLIGIELGLLTPALFQALPDRIFGVMSNETLLAIPFFTFMGLILERAGMAELPRGWVLHGHIHARFRLRVPCVRPTIFGAGSAIGFSLVLVLFAGIRERVEGADVPVHFRGVAIAMVTAGLMSLAFMGFAGLDKYQ